MLDECTATEIASNCQIIQLTIRLVALIQLQTVCMHCRFAEICQIWPNTWPRADLIGFA